jgi:hypothetical protein
MLQQPPGQLPRTQAFLPASFSPAIRIVPVGMVTEQNIVLIGPEL